MSMPVKTFRACYQLRKNGELRPLVSVEGNLYDMSIYVDLLGKIMSDNSFDYLIVEPIRFKDTIF